VHLPLLLPRVLCVWPQQQLRWVLLLLMMMMLVMRVVVLLLLMPMGDDEEEMDTLIIFLNSGFVYLTVCLLVCLFDWRFEICERRRRPKIFGAKTML
jgi:hypothetical protein